MLIAVDTRIPHDVVPCHFHLFAPTDFRTQQGDHSSLKQGQSHEHSSYVLWHLQYRIESTHVQCLLNPTGASAVVAHPAGAHFML